MSSKKGGRGTKADAERKRSKQSDEANASLSVTADGADESGAVGSPEAPQLLVQSLDGLADGASPQLAAEADIAPDEPTLTELIVESYEGTREHGQFDGQGVCIFTSGNFYAGSFSEGTMHGTGKYTWQELGITYEGEFSRNQVTGKGVYFWPDGSTYEGDVVNGIRHGFGVFRHPCGLSYTGQWFMGKRHGEGRLEYDSESRSFYDGEWRENTRHGWGFRRYPSGNTYEGMWFNGHRHGQGSMRWLDRNEAYTGQWENGVQQGMGQHVWFVTRVTGSQYPLRNLYDGEFNQAKRHGWGCFYYPNGARYEGQWIDNMKHGHGKFVFKNGRVFEGEFENDKIKEFPSFAIDGRVTPDLEQIRTRSPLPCETASVRSNESRNTEGPSFQLYLEWVGQQLPADTSQLHVEEEAQQTLQVISRHLGALRRIYHLYSGLGLTEEQSQDNTHAMNGLQFWRLLKDCRLHQMGMELMDIDRLLAESSDNWSHSLEGIHSPKKQIVFLDFVNYLVILSFRLYSADESGKTENLNTPRTPRTALLATCLDRLVTEQLLPYSCTVRGLLFADQRRAQQAMRHGEKAYAVYLNACRPGIQPPHEPVLRMRELLFLLQDYKLINENLTAKSIVDVLSSDDPTVSDGDFINLEKEITFLEFFECLIGCAEVYVTDSVIQDPSTPRIEDTATQGQTVDAGLGSQSGASLAVTEAQDGESDVASESRTPEPSATATVTVMGSEMTTTTGQQSETRSAHRGSHAHSRGRSVKSSASKLQGSSTAASQSQQAAAGATSGVAPLSHRTSNATQKIKEADVEAVASSITLVQSEVADDESVTPATPAAAIEIEPDPSQQDDQEQPPEIEETPVSPATRAFNFWTHQVHIFFVRKFFVAADRMSVIENRVRVRQHEEAAREDEVEEDDELEMLNGEMRLEVPSIPPVEPVESITVEA